MFIKTNTIGQICQIITDNIFIKDKTVVIINKTLIHFVVEDVLQYIKENNLNDIEKITIIKNQEYYHINNIILTCLIDGSLVCGLRAKNIIVYNYERLDKDYIDNIIAGYSAISG